MISLTCIKSSNGFSWTWDKIQIWFLSTEQVCLVAMSFPNPQSNGVILKVAKSTVLSPIAGLFHVLTDTTAITQYLIDRALLRLG